MQQVFSRDECVKVIEYAEKKNNWQKVQWYPKVITDDVAEYELCDVTELDWFKDKLVTYALTTLDLNLSTPSISIIKYKEGCKFPRHIDRISSKEFNRDFLYNINVVLNDNFEGGEFWVDDKLLIGNSPGVVYHYKSTQWHEVKTVTKGVRYSTLFYVRERDINKTKNLI